MSSSNGIVVHVLITVEPSRLDEFLVHLKKQYKRVSAEPNVIFFETTVRRETGEVRLYEAWSEDAKWFNEVQLKKDYYKPYLEATEHMWIKPRIIDIFERLEPDWTYFK